MNSSRGVFFLDPALFMGCCIFLLTCLGSVHVDSVALSLFSKMLLCVVFKTSFAITSLQEEPAVSTASRMDDATRMLLVLSELFAVTGCQTGSIF